MTFNSLVEDQVNLHLVQATDPFAPQAVAQAPQGLGMVPIVIEQSGRGERAYDIYSRLLRERVARRGVQQLGVTGQGLGAAAGLGGGLGQERPVKVLGQRPGQGADTRVSGVAGDDEPPARR